MNGLCRSLLPIADDIDVYKGALRESCLAAFQLYERFVESYAADAGEILLHRQLEVERARELIGRPYSAAGPYSSVDDVFYQSPVLMEHRRRLESENDCSIKQLPGRYPGEYFWRGEVDPCQRRLKKESMNDRRGHDDKWNAVRQEIAKERQLESRRYVGEVPADAKDSVTAIFDLWVDSFTRHLSPLGFSLQKTKGKRSYPLFVKPLSDDWDLCWELETARRWQIEDARQVLQNQALSGRAQSFEPVLELRRRGVLGPGSSIKLGEVLVLPIQKLLPGFFHAYGWFIDLPELLLAISANLVLYCAMEPKLLQGLARATDQR